MATNMPAQEFKPEWHAPPAASAESERYMPPVAPAPMTPDRAYNDQFIESLVARLTPRLVYELRVQNSMPRRAVGYRLALAIVSVALLIPLIALALGAAQQFNAGFFEWLIGVGVICFTVLLINLVFDMTKS
jgi:hypothetical protein